MNIDSSSLTDDTNRGGNDVRLTAVRHCLCHFVVEENNNIMKGNNEEEVSGDSTVRCSVCVQNLLRPHIQRHKRALEDHMVAKEYCSQQLKQIPRDRIPELQAESQRLRDRLTSLRKECGDMAVKVAQTVLENDTIRETITIDKSVERRCHDLQRLERSLLEGSMIQAIETATSQVRFFRFRWAQKVFAIYRVDIDPEDIKLTPLQKRRQESQPGQQLQRRARGISKISGLPLPNAGPELYGVLPPQELQSALRLVATVTSTVARCLGIVLPHRILLTLNNSSAGDIIDTVTEDDLQQRRRHFRVAGGIGERSSKDESSIDVQNKYSDNSFFHPNCVGDDNNNNSNNGAAYGITTGSNNHISPAEGGYSSTASLLSLMGGSYWTNKAKKAKDVIIGRSKDKIKISNKSIERSETATNNTFISTDATIVSQRLDHATAAILTDVDSTTNTANNNSSKFALSSKLMNQDDFAIALQLLQNDVIVLCIRAGVKVSKLWPAEAMLLNLYELDKFCQHQTSVDY
ncbi:hypothetical protein FRACYDRAFT_232934 [Fragilariopsis cylindrus CCMP1102]|uniref:Uncharacterized protein n=1 Tax=Fragilariopsis cylindrus CCMP1102 TaxID=635003 RepID=A0A1E7FXB3_9STRA|nr:hypothetical protein FRACYDRAFT_232934 [Fragilariopsis cylindrus CCMP1102]|eukprot:OEU22774.1 hypothetical protein FRACYDRAFT_232934 [Fragilariopsis cylindrus CCMP1102]